MSRELSIQSEAVSRQLATQLADRVKHLRHEKGWSIRVLEERSGVARSTISTIENGKLPDLTTIITLALSLGVTSLEEMFGAMPPTRFAFERAAAEIRQSTVDP